MGLGSEEKCCVLASVLRQANGQHLGWRVEGRIPTLLIIPFRRSGYCTGKTQQVLSVHSPLAALLDKVLLQSEQVSILHLHSPLSHFLGKR